jgi:hypothetical protein
MRAFLGEARCVVFGLSQKMNGDVNRHVRCERAGRMENSDLDERYGTTDILIYTILSTVSTLQ